MRKQRNTISPRGRGIVAVVIIVTKAARAKKDLTLPAAKDPWSRTGCLVWFPCQASRPRVSLLSAKDGPSIQNVLAIVLTNYPLQAHVPLYSIPTPIRQ